MKAPSSSRWSSEDWRGEIDVALRIQIEERLPLAQGMDDLYTVAHIRSACAHARIARRGLKD